MSSVTGRDSSADRLEIGKSFADSLRLRPENSAVSHVWLDGEVLSCACPDCGAPMSIRLWLRLAECRMCGAQVELTEEQERLALELLANREQPGTVAQPKPWSKSPPPKLPPLPILSVPSAAAVRPPPLPQPQPIAAPLIAEPVYDDEPPAVSPPPLPAKVPQDSRKRFRFGRHVISAILSALINMAIIVFLGLLVAHHERRLDLVVLEVDLRPKADGGPKGGELIVKSVTQEAAGKQPITPTVAPAAIAAKLQELTLPPVSTSELTTKLLESATPNMPLQPSAGAGSNVAGTLLGGRDPALRTKVLETEGGSERSEIAVAMGLKWLAVHQSRDGAWRLHDFYDTKDCRGRCRDPGTTSDTAGTALGLLPFLGAGFTHRGTGDYRETVDDALRFLLDHQNKKTGEFSGENDRGNSPMYAHGMATIAVCEAYALTKDSKLLLPAQKAVDFIVAAQHDRGGWRYAPKMPGDLSVVGWQVMALRSAQMAGLKVPEITITRSNSFLASLQKAPSEALYSYMPYGNFTETMTAEGLLCRLYSGWRANFPPLLHGVDWLLENAPPTKDDPNMYYWYYATQVMHHVGGERWKQWNDKMRPLLIEMQTQEGHEAGSWTPGGHYDTVGGRLYMTALAVCTLEVYYRHLPIYKNQALLSGKAIAAADENGPKATPPTSKKARPLGELP